MATPVPNPAVEAFLANLASQAGKGSSNPAGGDFVKLFVGSVPKALDDDEIRGTFAEFGTVLELAVIRSRPNTTQGCAFVKYPTMAEAEAAVRALHNQKTFPGATSPMQVRLADGERDRLGLGPLQEHKLFVGSCSRDAVEADINRLFSKFGKVEDVYIMRDQLKQSRGCCFVKFNDKDAAMNAIQELNGVFTMPGADAPLQVRFADPKRKPGEERGPGGMGMMPPFGGGMQRPFMPGGMMGGMGPRGMMMGPGGPMWRGMGGGGMGMGMPGGPGGMMGPRGPGMDQQQHHHQQQPQHHQQQQAQQPTSVKDPSQPQAQQTPAVAPWLQQPAGMPMMQQQYPGSAPPMAPAPAPAAPATCDWAEYTAPDTGFKYYYNSVTGVSVWEKPPELAAFEAQQAAAAAAPPSFAPQGGMGMPPQMGGFPGMSGPPQGGMPNFGGQFGFPGMNGAAGQGQFQPPQQQQQQQQSEPQYSAPAQQYMQPMGQFGNAGAGMHAPSQQAAHGGSGGGGGGDNHAQGPPGANLFVFRIPDDFTDATMRETFAPYGNVVSARVGVEPGTGRNRGFGFVSYDNPASADAAIQGLNGTAIGGRRLKVEKKRGEDQRSGGGQFNPY